MVDISIIIINYNTADYTINCLKSILDHTSKNLECQYMIVDNGSEKESFREVEDFVRSLDSICNIELIRSNINTGFGGGNMMGVQKAHGKYIAFINNDVVLNDDCLSILKYFMDQNEHVGVCGPQAFKPDKTILPTIDHFASLGREILGRRYLEFFNPHKYPKRKKLYDVPIRGQFVAGSFMFFNSEAFYEIGGFDTNIFLFYEETDICKRLERIGKYAYLVPNASFIHYHGMSTEKSISTKIELKISLLYVVRKHYGMVPFYVLLTFLQIRYFFSSIFKPKYWPLLKVLILQAPLDRSLKHKQKMKSLK